MATAFVDRPRRAGGKRAHRPKPKEDGVSAETPSTLRSLRCWRAYWQTQPQAIRVLGETASGPTSVGVLEGYPRPAVSTGRPVAGYRVVPDASTEFATQVLLGVRPLKPGRFVLRRIRVVYRVGEKRYVAHGDASFTLCVAKRRPAGECRLAH